MMLSQDQTPIRRPLRYIADEALIERLARRYDPDNGDTVKEYCETLGVDRDTQRQVRSAILKKRKELCLSI